MYSFDIDLKTTGKEKQMTLAYFMYGIMVACFLVLAVCCFVVGAMCRLSKDADPYEL